MKWKEKRWKEGCLETNLTLFLSIGKFNYFKSHFIVKFKFFYNVKKKEENEKNEVIVSEKWKKYIDKIDKAMKEYETCESLNCSCYKR